MYKVKLENKKYILYYGDEVIGEVNGKKHLESLIKEYKRRLELGYN